jgi:meiotically up-regulated gene 157 (Mug157) protein
MIAELKISQASPTTPPASSSKTINPISQQFSDTDSISSHDSTDSDTRILEENFGKINLEPKLQRIFDNSKPVNFARNWYSRPTPPDLQFEERFLQSQFSVSADKLYEWNIDGLSEQELMNKMNHMSRLLMPMTPITI